MKSITREQLVAKLSKLSYGEVEGDTFFVTTPKEAHCEYAEEKALFHIMFEGSSLYYAFNHYDEPKPYDRDNDFNAWLKAHDCYMELDHSYCGQIYQNY